jgi:hypothetical protein
VHAKICQSSARARTHKSRTLRQSLAPLDEVAGELTVYSFYCRELQAVLLAFIAKFSSVAGTSPIARQGATGRVLRLALASTG